MARISGVDLPRDKRVATALTYIFGVGNQKAMLICSESGINPETKVNDLTEDEVAKIRGFIDANLTVEGELRRDVQQAIRRKIDIQCYQGRRHVLGLPVRGQKTQTNARTRKGPRKAVAGKKKATRK